MTSNKTGVPVPFQTQSPRHVITVTLVTVQLAHFPGGFLLQSSVKRAKSGEARVCDRQGQNQSTNLANKSSGGDYDLLLLFLTYW